jgi:hypothetical protein
LDTREKIVLPAEARIRLSQGNWLVLAGYFDPLTAAVAERFRDLEAPDRDEKVFAIVLDEAETLLSAQARSVLVAALRDVHAVVVMPERDLKSFTHSFIHQDSHIRFVFDEEAERKTSSEFVALVLAKERLQSESGEPGS